MREISIFNIKVNPLRRSEFISLIRAKIEQGNKVAQFGVNSSTVNELIINDEFRHALNNATLLNIDGMSVVWALRFLGFKVPERVATPDLADDILAMAEREKFSVFLFGAREEIVLSCRDNLLKSLPDLDIAGYRNGYFESEDEASIINMINIAKPDILLLGMSSSRKELFFDKYKKDLTVKYILGVGGYFDIIAGRTKRAPKWMQNNGLEWLFRFIQEPRRMWPRYTVGIGKFIILVMKEKLRKTK
jgi:N-acetylglucosaminyldiphosphoundecaprenol N-acetyl-beta-D-mannosaminyltransferase